MQRAMLTGLMRTNRCMSSFSLSLLTLSIIDPTVMPTPLGLSTVTSSEPDSLKIRRVYIKPRSRKFVVIYFGSVASTGYAISAKPFLRRRVALCRGDRARVSFALRASACPPASIRTSLARSLRVFLCTPRAPGGAELSACEPHDSMICNRTGNLSPLSCAQTRERVMRLARGYWFQRSDDLWGSINPACLQTIC